MYFLAFLIICEWHAYQNCAPAIITITSLIFLLYFFFSKSKGRTSQLPPPPPGPMPWPLVGCLPAMLMSKLPRHRWIHSILNQFNTDIACIRLGQTHLIPVTSPELAMEFLKTHDAVFASRPITMATRMFSDGFLTTVVSPSGDQQKKMRRILSSEILTSSTLRWMLTKKADEADFLLYHIFTLTTMDAGDKLRAGGAVVNLRSITQHYCRNVIRRMLFSRRYYGSGREGGGPSFHEEEHLQALFTVLRHVNAFCISDYIPCLEPFDLDGHKKNVKRAFNIIKKYDEPIMDERLQQWRNGEKKEPEDILDLMFLLKDERGNSLLSVKEIKAQIIELQLASVDNPSNAVEWAMAELLNEPELLQKAVEELDKVVGRERLVQESDIPQLKYLMACARESFRLHPFAPFNMPHVSNSDMVVANYFIPKGSQVLLSRRGLGQNPRIWKNPMKFDPERHLVNGRVELGLSEPNLQFITFSRGRRGCMGGALGTSITMMLFARVLQGFTWSLPSGMMKIELSQSDDDLFLVNPLQLYAEPRLAPIMYMYPKAGNQLGLN